MRFLRPTLALLALPTAIIAVSLSDFTPRVSDLPANCQTVYTESISGCSASDFASSSCSKSCIEGLNSFTAKVKSGCGNKGIGGNNIITTFLSGNGPGGLCSNAGSVLGGSSESAAATTSPAITASTSSLASSYSSTPSSTATSTSAPTSSSSAILSGTATATSLLSSASATDSSSGILLDTSSVPSATSTSSPSSTGNSQNNMNDNSGGGSPFDSEGNMNSLASVSSSCSLTAVLLTTAIIFMSALR